MFTWEKRDFFFFLTLRSAQILAAFGGTKGTLEEPRGCCASPRSDVQWFSYLGPQALRAGGFWSESLSWFFSGFQNFWTWNEALTSVNRYRKNKFGFKVAERLLLTLLLLLLPSQGEKTNLHSQFFVQLSVAIALDEVSSVEFKRGWTWEMETERGRKLFPVEEGSSRGSAPPG